jgi:hypothetical protein
MPKKEKLTSTAAVQKFLDDCDHPLKAAMEEIRRIVLSTDPEIEEQIKWNAPAFFYAGDMKAFDPKEYKRDILVYNLHKKEYLLLVFPTGAKIEDSSGLLEGNFPDGRKTVSFSSLEQVKQRANDLQTVIKKWLSLVEK